MERRLEQLKQHLQQSAPQRPPSPGPRETMTVERNKASFNPRHLTNYLDGSPEMTKLKEQILREIERDPNFRMDDVYDLSKEEWRERTMEKFKNFIHHLSHEPPQIFRLRMELVSLVDPGFWTRLGVHMGLFFGTLRGQATPAQFAYWLQRGAMDLQGMVGCFAMTELGHGSNVAGLETTAEFDAASDEFIINTPSLTATKWWIGGAAHSATHSAVFARLIVDGKDYGVKPFIVPLRNPQDYTLLPGISIGDIGMKMGRNGIDNGWIQFTNVRIPRTFMLMKHTKVTRSGVVKEPPLNQLAYGALIQGRVAMVSDSGNVAKKALTIAIRYGAVRRQFSSSSTPGEAETQLLDYTIHQHRLLPLVAQAYAMHFTSTEMTRLYDRLTEQLDRLKPAASGSKSPTAADQSSGSNLTRVLEQLKETHAASAGLKAFCTWNCLNIIEQCRQSLGGHGYSSYTGLANMYNDFAVQCSWEGDNTILALQSGRYLIGCYREVKATGKPQPEGVRFLNDLSEVLASRCPAQSPAEIADLTLLGQAFDNVTANLVRQAGEEFEQCLAKGMDADAAYEETAISRLFAAKAHSFGYIFHRFHDAVRQAPDSIRPVMTRLCALYGLYTVQENAGNFLQFNHMSAQQMTFVRQQVLDLCRLVRSDAVALVDAFNLPDFLLNSPLGRYDGDVYVNYFNHVKQRNPPQHPPSYFKRVIYPLIHRKPLDDSEPGDDGEDEE